MLLTMVRKLKISNVPTNIYPFSSKKHQKKIAFDTLTSLYLFVFFCISTRVRCLFVYYLEIKKAVQNLQKNAEAVIESNNIIEREKIRENCTSEYNSISIVL